MRRYIKTFIKWDLKDLHEISSWKRTFSRELIIKEKVKIALN
jgi:hypothetical protein